jgi:DNA-binding NtrC family response regulator
MLNTLDEPALLGQSPAIAQLRQTLDRVARSDSKVLVTGESGSGKELVAQTLHHLSPRAQQPFVAVNCAGLPDGLLESELFGHVRGSFTGAYRDKPGKFEDADRGTILLDEVGEMSLRMQGLLLRFLETGEIQKIGAEYAPGHVEVRVIASTNRDLRQLAEEGRFRPDLFYRLNVIHIKVPPLRERREDIALLAKHFLGVYATRHPGELHGFSDDALAAMTAYAWPGNVRELQNVVERLVLTAHQPIAGVDALPADIRRPKEAARSHFRERRRTIADELYRQMKEERISFWAAVYPLYLQRDITRGNIRDLVRKGLEESRGNYKIVARLFNLEEREYKRFLNFLRKNDCQLPFRDYR